MKKRLVAKEKIHSWLMKMTAKRTKIQRSKSFLNHDKFSIFQIPLKYFNKTAKID